jgi:hypothetical protein
LEGSLLEQPRYIADAQVSDTKLKKWDGTTHYVRESPRLTERFVPIGPSGVLAIGFGIAEWVYWRYHELANNPDRLLYIEAAWAFEIDPAYAKIWKKSSEDAPKDPVGGPLFAMKGLVSSLMYAERARRKSPETSRGGPTRHVVEMAFLARYAVPKPRPFDTWLEEVLERFARTHPDPSNNGYGEPVPRLLLDPSVEYNDKAVPGLLDDFLKGLDYRSNSNLRSPEEMKAEGFTGTPYHYAG